MESTIDLDRFIESNLKVTGLKVKSKTSNQAKNHDNLQKLVGLKDFSKKQTINDIEKFHSSERSNCSIVHEMKVPVHSWRRHMPNKAVVTTSLRVPLALSNLLLKIFSLWRDGFLERLSLLKRWSIITRRSQLHFRLLVAFQDWFRQFLALRSMKVLRNGMIP